MAFRLFFALILLCSLIRPASADTLRRITRQEVLRVGTTGDYLPFSGFGSSHKSYRGFDIEMAQAMGRALHVKVVFIRTTWSTLMADLLANRFDMAVGGISITPERSKAAYMSHPYLESGKIPLTQCRYSQDYQTLAQIDAPEVTVIENAGGTNEAFARRYLKQARLLIVEDNPSIFPKLLKGEADVMITDATEARYQHRMHPELCAVNPDHPFVPKQFGYLISKSNPELLEWVNQWLDQAGKAERKRQLQRWLD